MMNYLFWSILISGQPDHLAGHLVYRLDDLEHLIVRNGAILVDVIELERPWRTVLRQHTVMMCGAYT